MSLLEAIDFIMKKKILSLHEHYDFEDLKGNKPGEADGNLIQAPPKFEVKDPHDLELMHLQGKVFSMRHEFTFHGLGGEELGTIKKKIAKLVGEEFWVEKNGAEFMRIYGNFTEHEYQLEVDWGYGCFGSQEMGNPKRPTWSINNRRRRPPSSNRSGYRDRTHRSYRETIFTRTMEHKRQVLEIGPQEINQMGSIKNRRHRPPGSNRSSNCKIDHVEVVGHKLPQVHGSRTFDFRH